jgi:hypothetical protein
LFSKRIYRTPLAFFARLGDRENRQGGAISLLRGNLTLYQVIPEGKQNRKPRAYLRGRPSTRSAMMLRWISEVPA